MSDPDPDATQRPAAASPELEPTGIYSPLDSASELVRVLDQYLADLQAGKAPDKASLLADHPELAEQLEDCLAGIEFVHRAAKPATETPTQLGDFRITREVGHGGMGIVYEAQQLSLKRKVALKVLQFGVTTDTEVMRRFQREAETVAHLHHTNIVPIHAVGCEQGVHYYAMQFIEGRSLAAVEEELNQGSTTHVAGTEWFQEVARWMLQAAEALAHAHQRGVIHRDIKPSNLILDPEGTVWLTDFGLAKRADEVTLTAAGILMGTPRYMSPEQAATTRQPIDHRTDIYSLGATLYELATGKPVFESQTPQGVITQILNADPVAPRLVQGQLPRDLETIILKCLAKEPARRYQTARDLADDLRAFLENRPIRARRVSLVERAVRWSRKHRRSTAVAGLAAVASALLIAVGVTVWNAYKESLNGRLSLTTEGPSLVAEVLDDHDELVIPGFPVPNPEPVVLPAGSYRVRLSASGTLSETWRMDVPRGDPVTYPVKLVDRSLPPQDVLSRDPPALIELDGRQHVLLGAEQGWRLLNGATWQSIWPGDWKWPESPLVPTDPRTLVSTEEWRQLLQGYSERGSYYAPSTGNSPGLARPAVDIDGDGRQDVIFASRVSPSLLAVSAQSGNPLWWFRALPPFPADHDLNADPLIQSPAHENAGIVGQPIMVDIAGEPAVVSLFLSVGANLRTKSGNELIVKNTSWMEAVAARTGKSLWRSPVTALDPTAYYLNLIEKFPHHPVITQLGQQQAVIAVIDSKLLALDLATGQPIDVPQPGAALVQAPQFGDLDGDGQTDVLLVERQGENLQTLALRAISFASRATLWERSFLPAGHVDRERPRPAGAELAWITPRGANHKTEVLVAIRDDYSHLNQTSHWFGLEALDGATGQPCWNQKFWSLGKFSGSGDFGEDLRMAFQRAFWTSHGAVAPTAPGPDLDGDGTPELFAASIGSLLWENARSLRVDALSGQDGRFLWRRKYSLGDQGPSSDRPTAVQFGPAGADGWPQLVVPVLNGPGGQATTYFLSASTGQVEHTLAGVGNPECADLTGDGIPDIMYLTGAQGSQKLLAIRGALPAEWRRPGNWKPIPDVNGDAFADFVETKRSFQDWQPSSLIAHSGRDGQILWRTEIRPPYSAGPDQILHPDLNADGTPDLIFFEQGVQNPGSTQTVAAISGSDGKRLWTAPDFGMQNGSTSNSGGGPQMEYHYPLLDLRDLDGDGQPEILAGAYIGIPNTVSLAALSSHDGRLLWKIPIHNGAYIGRSFIDRNVWHDIDGDGCDDLVLWVPQSFNEQGLGNGFTVRAFGGRDGTPLWKDVSYDGLGWFLWPRCPITDLDGDGQHEVVVTSSNPQGQPPRELAVLDARTGAPKWKWSWLAEEHNFWPPLPVNVHGDGRNTLCLATHEQGQPSAIVVFDGQGTIQQRIPLRWLPQASTWAAVDVGGDGSEELLFVDDNQLQAFSLRDQSTAWQFRAQGIWRLDDFRPGLAGEPAMLVGWLGRTVTGLRADAGKEVWRGEVPAYDNYQLEAELAWHGDSNRPTVVSHDVHRKSTLAQRAALIDREGHDTLPAPAPIQFPAYVPPVRYRALPWAERGPQLAPTHLRFESHSTRILRLLEWPLILVVICTFGRWAITGRNRRALAYLVFYLGVTAVVCAVTIWMFASRLEPDEAFSWTGWYWGLYIGGITVGFLTLVAVVCLYGWRFGRRMLAGASAIQ